MDLFELKKEQYKLANRIILRDGFSSVKTIGGTACVELQGQILACVVVCEFPSMVLKEKKFYVLNDPLPYRQDLVAFREVPALIEAFNLLDEDPDIIFVHGSGILHPRRVGLASHLGLVLNKPTIGVDEKLSFGQVENGKIVIDNDIKGFEVTTKEFAYPIYVSPGHLITLGSALRLITESIKYPHKMPEPLHLAHKIGKKEGKGMRMKNGI